MNSKSRSSFSVKEGRLILVSGRLTPFREDKNSPLLMKFRRGNKNDESLSNHTDTMNTHITNIEYNISKHGVLIPRIQFEEVNLSGSKVKFCSGVNARNIIEQKLNPEVIFP